MFCLERWDFLLQPFQTSPMLTGMLAFLWALHSLTADIQPWEDWQVTLMLSFCQWSISLQNNKLYKITSLRWMSSNKCPPDYCWCLSSLTWQKNQTLFLLFVNIYFITRLISHWDWNSFLRVSRLRGKQQTSWKSCNLISSHFSSVKNYRLISFF